MNLDPGKFRDWSSKIGEAGVIRAIPVYKWIVIAPVRMRANMQKFVDAYVQRMAVYLRTSIAAPYIKYISQDTTRDYMTAIRECDFPDVELFVIGLMSQREDKYQVSISKRGRKNGS